MRGLFSLLTPRFRSGAGIMLDPILSRSIITPDIQCRLAHGRGYLGGVLLGLVLIVFAASARGSTDPTEAGPVDLLRPPA